MRGAIGSSFLHKEKNMCTTFQEFGFYTVNELYLQFLNNTDKEVMYEPLKGYDRKPFVGILVLINSYNYFIPLTSAKPKHAKWKNRDKGHFLIYRIISKDRVKSAYITKPFSEDKDIQILAPMYKGECGIDNINIISLCNDINTKVFNYKEELKNIKNDIKNSSWKKRRHYLKGENPNYDFIINSFLDLYNYNINSNNKIEPNVTKYSVYIPFFIKREVFEPISFIGSLNRPHKMKNYKGYICLDDSFGIYLDKTLLHKNNSIYKYSNKKKCEFAIEKLFKTHYIFKNINIEFLKKNFGKYLEMYTAKKNDVLFKQNEPHKGIYIITKGSFQLKTFQAYNKLNDLNYILLHSLDNYPGFASKIKKNIIKVKNSLSIVNIITKMIMNMNTVMMHRLSLCLKMLI